MALFPQPFEQQRRIPVVFPAHRFLGAQRGLGKGPMRRVRGDSGQIQAGDSSRVGQAEKCTHVVKAAHLIEQHGNRQLSDAQVGGRHRSG